NIFEGGFLGLDNIGVFDRSRPLPTGGNIEQSDGTAWMAMFCLNMLRMSFELSRHDPAYEDMALKFLDHFLQIAGAMTDMGKEGIGLWDDQDNFFYDVLSMPSGDKIPMRLRSMVGLIPLFAVGCVEENAVDDMPELWHKFELYRDRRPDLVNQVSRWNQPGVKGRRLMALVRAFQRFYGDGLKIECPTGSGVMLTLEEVADELCRRLLKLFLRGPDGRRAVFGRYEKFQTDPHFKDYFLFHEYFHGDNGRGCGASHQTGWTGLIANLISQLAEQSNTPAAARAEQVSGEPVHG